MGRSVHALQGQKFGKWLVLNRSIPATNNQGNALWDCKCECGTLQTLPSKNLRKWGWMERNKMGSSGCKRCGIKCNDGASNDVTGLIFGTWHVLERIGTYGEGNNRKSSWRCECVQCGTIKDMVRGVLVTGEPDGRGSSQCPQCKSVTKQTSKDNLIGQIFGDLTVQRIDGDMAFCICFCGKTEYRPILSLLYQGVSRCKECNKPAQNTPFEAYCAEIRRSASSRNLEFTLTPNFLEDIFTGNCVLSGVPIFLHSRRGNTASIDRIDSNKGYTEDNVQWVHVCINIAKQTLSQSQFISMCAAITKTAMLVGTRIQDFNATHTPFQSADRR